MYERLSVSLGADFDNAAATQELRVTNWVSPVYARLQRRFVRFLSSNVDEKTEEMNDASFNRLLERVPLKINPRYQLSGPLDTAVYSEVTENSEGRVYPPWDLTDFYMKILRNTVQCINPLTLEARVVTQLRNDLSSRMRSLSKHLERIYEESPTFLPEKDLKRVEEMLNIGQESVAAVLTIWQIRYNVVGTEGKNGERLKDFIMPASIRGKNTKAAYECIPVSSRGFVKADVDAVSSRLSPSPELLAAAVLSYALRETAGEDLRALVTYNSDSYDWPSSRDAVYVAVLSSVLVEALASPTQFNHMWLYENLVAMAALEETVGVREPRSSCIEGFENALVTVAMQLLQNKAAIPADMNSRVMEVEKALGMVLRFPEDQGIKSRTKAFKQTINKIISSSERQTGSSGMKEVEKEYEWISKMMLLDPQQAKNYIMPMRQSKFDKTAGQLLLNSDVVVSVPGLDRIFNEQMQTLAADLMIPTDEANERIGYIAGAVFESLIETAIQEHRRMNTPKFDAIMKRACKLFQHPLLLSLPPKQADSPSLQEIGMTMVIARLGTSAIMELVRILEETKLRALDQKKKLSMLDNPSAFSSAGG